MNSNDRDIDKAILKLETNGIVPLDEIFELVERGINFRDLDTKYNKNNRAYEPHP